MRKQIEPPLQPENSTQNQRKYLTNTEIDCLREAASQTGQQGLRDNALVLLMFRHGLRASGAIAFQWEHVDFKNALLHVNRPKNGRYCRHSTHPLRDPELHLLRELQHLYPHDNDDYVFLSKRKAPLTSRSVQHIVACAGKIAKFPFTVHPHMLRHSTRFYLASQGHSTRTIESYVL